MTLTLHIRLQDVTGISLAQFPNATGIFLKATLSPTGESQQTKSISRGSISGTVDFSGEVITFSIKESTLARAVLEIVLYLQVTPDPLAFAFLTLPVRICRPGTRVGSKITFTCYPFYKELIKGRWELHLATDARKRPFSDERAKLDATILQQFAEETRAGKIAKREEAELPIPDGATQEQVDAIEAALMTAPPEMWALFSDVNFLKNGLRYFRAPGAPPE
jgi:hypothetical protein